MSNWVVPVELKKGQLDTEHVAKQLQAGAKLCEQLISKSDNVNFQPVSRNRFRRTKGTEKTQ